MSAPRDRRRRRLVAADGAAPLLPAALSACAQDGERELRLASLDEALQEMQRLGRARQLVSAAAWSWPQTLVHCAQSIEYSMIGFPQERSAGFQRTVGAAAFGFFSWRGRMQHDRAEPIPGAPPLEPAQASGPAQERLWAAVHAFQAWQQPLKPHFAYGMLDKAAYERAHAMHLAHHFSAFEPRV